MHPGHPVHYGRRLQPRGRRGTRRWKYVLAGIALSGVLHSAVWQAADADPRVAIVEDG
jgi:hypothetical protein